MTLLAILVATLGPSAAVAVFAARLKHRRPLMHGQRVNVNRLKKESQL